jgi:hypothetical protein
MNDKFYMIIGTTEPIPFTKEEYAIDKLSAAAKITLKGGRWFNAYRKDGKLIGQRSFVSADVFSFDDANEILQILEKHPGVNKVEIQADLAFAGA